MKERSDECCRWNKQEFSIYGLLRGHMKFVPQHHIYSYSGTQGRETKGQIGEVRSLRHLTFEMMGWSHDRIRGCVSGSPLVKLAVSCKSLAVRGSSRDDGEQ